MMKAAVFYGEKDLRIEAEKIDVKSMISNRFSLEELEKVLGDSAMRSQGKIIINL